MSGVNFSEQDLKNVNPKLSDEKTRTLTNNLNEALDNIGGIDSEREKKHFLSQIAQESGHLTATVESLNYHAGRLHATFPNVFANDAAAQNYINRGQEAVANHVYANKNGNGNEQSGDGWAYRGRSLMQVTGRGNYESAQKVYNKSFGTNYDFIAHPELVGDAKISAGVALSYWKERSHHVYIANEALDDKALSKKVAYSILGGNETLYNKNHNFQERVDGRYHELQNINRNELANHKKEKTPEYNSSPDKYTAPQSANTIDTQPLSKTHQSLIADVEKHVHGLYKEYGLPIDQGTHHTIMAVAAAAAEQGMTRIDRSVVKDDNINVAQMDGHMLTMASVNGNAAANTSVEQSLSKLAAIEQQQIQAMNNPSQTIEQPKQGRSIS